MGHLRAGRFRVELDRLEYLLGVNIGSFIPGLEPNPRSDPWHEHVDPNGGC